MSCQRKRVAAILFPGCRGNSRAPVRTSKVRGILCPRRKRLQRTFGVETVYCLQKFFRGTQPAHEHKTTRRDPCHPLTHEIIDSLHGHDHKSPFLTQNHNFYLLGRSSVLDLHTFAHTGTHLAPSFILFTIRKKLMSRGQTPFPFRRPKGGDRCSGFELTQLPSQYSANELAN